MFNPLTRMFKRPPPPPHEWAPALVAIVAAVEDPDWAHFWKMRFSDIPPEVVEHFFESHPMPERPRKRMHNA